MKVFVSHLSKTGSWAGSLTTARSADVYMSKAYMVANVMFRREGSLDRCGHVVEMVTLLNRDDVNEHKPRWLAGNIWGFVGSSSYRT